MTLDGFTFNLLLAATGIAFMHTVLGPDHYLPFVMLARACRWSTPRTLTVTFLCGIGHVAFSLLLGGIGIGLGLAVARIEHLEGIRGDWAAWGLIAFGAAYALWGIRRAVRTKKGLVPHHHHHGSLHIHTGGGGEHEHETHRKALSLHHEHCESDLHGHDRDEHDSQRRDLHENEHPPHDLHAHEHHAYDSRSDKVTDSGDGAVGEPGPRVDGAAVTFWTLFAVFVLGPCEPLIPLFVLPASRGRWDVATLTAVVFGAITISTMTALTWLGLTGLRKISSEPLQRWAHAMAGGVIALSGVAIVGLGL